LGILFTFTAKIKTLKLYDCRGSLSYAQLQRVGAELQPVGPKQRPTALGDLDLAEEVVVLESKEEIPANNQRIQVFEDNRAKV